MAASDQQIFDELVKLNRTMAKVGKFIDNSDGENALDGIAEGFSTITDRIDKKGSKLTREMNASTRNIGDMQKKLNISHADAIRVYDQNREKFLKTGQVTDAMRADMAALGMENVSLTRDTRDFSKELKNYHTEMRDFASSYDDAADKMRHSDTKTTESRAKNSRVVEKVFTALAIAGKEALDVTKASMQAGVKITANEIYQSRLMGMSHLELIGTQKEFKQSISASGMTTNEFTKMMLESSNELMLSTGSLKDGAVFAANAMKQFRMLGGGTEEEQSEYAARASQAFNKLNSITGSTLENFTKLNDDLINNSDIQQKMFKMDKKRRAGYMLELMDQRNRLAKMGMFEEQAQEVIKSIAEMTSKDGKSRLQDAAKMEAALGAMGMGQEGKIAADILRKGARASKEEQAQLALIMTKAAKESAKRQQGSLGQEIAQDQLLDKTGMDKYFGPNSAAAKAVTMAGNALDDRTDPTADATWQSELLASIMKFNERLSTLLGDGWMLKFAGTLATGLAARSAFGKLGTAGGMGAAGARAGGGKGSLLKRSWGTVAKNVGKLAGIVALVSGKFTAIIAGIGGALSTIAGAIASSAVLVGSIAGVVAGITGWLAGSALNDYINEHMPEVGKTIGGTVNEMVESLDDGTVLSDAAKYHGKWMGDLKDNVLGFLGGGKDETNEDKKALKAATDAVNANQDTTSAVETLTKEQKQIKEAGTLGDELAQAALLSQVKDPEAVFDQNATLKTDESEVRSRTEAEETAQDTRVRQLEAIWDVAFLLERLNRTTENHFRNQEAMGSSFKDTAGYDPYRSGGGTSVYS